MAEWIITKRKHRDLIDQLLYNRGVFGEGKREAFLHPDFVKNMHDPYLLSGMQEAVGRILLAKGKNQKIGIFADYDADGIPGGALLYKTFKKIGFDCEVYIPTRQNGYGLSESGIDYLVDEKKCDFIITVDLGIRSFNEAIYCKKKKIDLIITDHHIPDAKVPKAFAVINPKLSEKYPFPDLCGCAVAYKLAWALSHHFPKELTESFLKWNLDLVAISTISDVVPLIEENRVLAKYGITVLQKTKNIGLQELYKVAEIDSEKLNVHTVGFQIGPRINAPGRIDHATKSFELLVTDDRSEAVNLAVSLDEKNKLRQVSMEKTEKEAIKQVEHENLLTNKVIISSGKWTKGVIGPASSHLAEKFSRPVILFAEDKNNMVGSARSFGEINILEIISSAKVFLEKFGGHKGAAGITVSKKNYNKMLEKIVSFANEKVNAKDLLKKIKIDAELELPDLDVSVIKKIKKLEPFGMGNPRPVFMIWGVKINGERLVGSEKNHLSFFACLEDKMIKSICFNFSEKFEAKKDVLYDLAFNMEIDDFRNIEKVNLNIVDMKIHE